MDRFPIPVVKNAAYCYLHGVVIAVHNARDPRREEWDIYLAMVRRVKAALDGDCSKFKQLIFTDGGAPSAAQRHAVVSLSRGTRNADKLRVAIVSRSAVARGIVTAFRWLGFPLRSFAPDELAAMFAFLEISNAEARDLCGAIAELCASIDGSVHSASRIEAYRAALGG
jgi:hypothetical protein